MADRARWFHGGRPGIRPPRRLLPPAVTGTLTSADLFTALTGQTPWEQGMEPDRARRDLVYLTRSVQLARAHAAAWALTGRGPHGTLYEAVPAPDAEPDADFEADFPGLCVQASYANVIAVPERVVVLPARRWRLIVLRYTTWKAGRCPDCGHDAAAPGPACDCLGCVCGPYREDPTALGRVDPAPRFRAWEDGPVTGENVTPPHDIINSEGAGWSRPL